MESDPETVSGTGAPQKFNQFFRILIQNKWNGLYRYTAVSLSLARSIIASPLSFNKKLSCHREASRCFESLNISLSHSRSLKAIRNGAIRQIEYEFLLAFHSNYGPILYHF